MIEVWGLSPSPLQFKWMATSTCFWRKGGLSCATSKHLSLTTPPPNSLPPQPQQITDYPNPTIIPAHHIPLTHPHPKWFQQAQNPKKAQTSPQTSQFAPTYYQTTYRKPLRLHSTSSRIFWGRFTSQGYAKLWSNANHLIVLIIMWMFWM